MRFPPDMVTEILLPQLYPDLLNSNAHKTSTEALAGVAQWIECWPMNQRVAGSIPSQGTCLCCGPGPQWGRGMHERQPHIDVSLPLFPSFPLSLKINE